MKKIILVSAILGLFLMSCSSKSSTAEQEAADEATVKENPVSNLDGIWELNYISGPKIAFEGLYPDKKPFLSFNTGEGRVSGNSGCNSFTGNASISTNRFRVDENLAMTKMFCPGEGENNFMESLKKVNTYSISDEGKTLNLIMGDIAIMRFSKK